MADVHKSFAGKALLQGVDFQVPAGASLGIIGPAAAGKSVILKLVSGLLRPDRGDIHVAGQSISDASEDDLAPLRARIGMLFQNFALFDFMTVAENVAFPLVQRGDVPDGEIAERVEDRLRKVGLAGTGDKMPAELSGGMKRRLGIARATIAKPDIAIYDEPTAGLDPVTSSKIYDLLRADQRDTGCTVLAVSSDVTALSSFADRIAMLYDGRIRYQGPADTIRDAADPIVRQFVRGDLTSTG